MGHGGIGCRGVHRALSCEGRLRAAEGRTLGPEDREPIGVVPDGVAGFHCDVPVLVLLVAPF